MPQIAVTQMGSEQFLKLQDTDSEENCFRGHPFYEVILFKEHKFRGNFFTRTPILGSYTISRSYTVSWETNLRNTVLGGYHFDGTPFQEGQRRYPFQGTPFQEVPFWSGTPFQGSTHFKGDTISGDTVSEGTSF